MKKFIVEIEQGMANLLNNMQMEELHKVLVKRLEGLTWIEDTNKKSLKEEKVDYCNIFISAKRVEGVY